MGCCSGRDGDQYLADENKDKAFENDQSAAKSKKPKYINQKDNPSETNSSDQSAPEPKVKMKNKVDQSKNNTNYELDAEIYKGNEGKDDLNKKRKVHFKKIRDRENALDSDEIKIEILTKEIKLNEEFSQPNETQIQ